jgi:hypothetical protein
MPPTRDEIRIGDRVRVHLHPKSLPDDEGWFEGRVVRIEPYSRHRSFYWVQLDAGLPRAGAGLISVLNPKNIEKLPQE